MNRIILLIFILQCAFTSNAQRIISDHLVTDISYLASDELQGRATSTKDELIAADYIAAKFEAIGLKPKGTKGYFFDYLYKYSKKMHDSNTADLPFKQGRNVLGFIDNGAKNTIVIGAHYDHLGLGFDHNSLDANPEWKIHNGADDNASGVAGVIELARYFSNNGITEKNNFLFMTFSGEELGLLGSKKWCENPSYPLSKINYMINMDMIGRLNDSTKKLLVYGVGTSSNWIPALEKVNTYFDIKNDSSGIGPSDQTSFYLKDIPVLHFFTGQHSDYHKPTDDADKINYMGEQKVLELIIDLVFEIDNQGKLNFLKTKNVETTATSFKVTLGVMPDYAFDGDGLRLDGITEGKPAFNAGMKVGDIIVQMGDVEIKNIQDYMKQLGAHKKGDTLPVLILRGGEILEMNVTF